LLELGLVITGSVLAYATILLRNSTNHLARLQIKPVLVLNQVQDRSRTRTGYLRFTLKNKGVASAEIINIDAFRLKDDSKTFATIRLSPNYINLDAVVSRDDVISYDIDNEEDDAIFSVTVTYKDIDLNIMNPYSFTVQDKPHDV
jgi:hypothetical protein